MVPAVQWSFLYAEYKPQKCFWEFVIMGRKLVFLAATILLPMALDTPEETTAQMQLLVCVMLAIFFLLLHASQHPFKRDVLNRLERLGLTAIALRCVVLQLLLVPIAMKWLCKTVVNISQAWPWHLLEFLCC